MTVNFHETGEPNRTRQLATGKTCQLVYRIHKMDIRWRTSIKCSKRLACTVYATACIYLDRFHRCMTGVTRPITGNAIRTQHHSTSHTLQFLGKNPQLTFWNIRYQNLKHTDWQIPSGDWWSPVLKCWHVPSRTFEVKREAAADVEHLTCWAVGWSQQLSAYVWNLIPAHEQ